MWRRGAQLFLVGALCCAVGLQWLALQSVAWASMLVQNARQQSLRQAISQTFDGAHPCSLCHLVQKGKASEKKQTGQSTVPKIDLFLALSAGLPGASFVPYLFPSRQQSLGEFIHAPPVPPPRFI